jgi:hypothetical protein
MRRKKFVLSIWILGLATLLAGCGSSSSSTPSSTPPPTNLKKRVLVSNQQGNVVNIIDASKDVLNAKTIGASGPTKMVTAGGQTAIIDSGAPQVSIFDNTKEAVTFAPLLADFANDVVITSDGKTAWVAEPNNGFVQSIDTASGVVTASVPVPSVERLVLSPNGTRLLAFSNNPQGLVGPKTPNPNVFINAFFVIDTTAANTSHVATPINLSPGDQPFSAVFNTSETQAFILNCGSGCGGVDATSSPTAPSVLSVDFTNPATPVKGPQLTVSAATVGVLLNGNIFVAGTTSPTATVSPNTGFLTVVSAASLTVVGTPLEITNGIHNVMIPASNNTLFIGSLECTPGPVQPNNTLQGCLTIANITNPAAATATVPFESSFRQNFNVTGIQPISNRNIVYVCEGGELDFFDTSTNAISTSITPIDIVGVAHGVVQIDP